MRPTAIECHNLY